MPTIYCHKCTVDLGIVHPASPVSLTGTQYQLEKYLKHTAPTGSYPVNSIFDDPSYEGYRSHIVSTLSSGSALVLDDGRVNMLWIAGGRVGARIENGKPVVPADAVTVVLADDEFHIHAFPQASSGLGVYDCDNCGVTVISSGSWGGLR